MASNYRASREPLVKQARDIARRLKEGSSNEIANAQQVVRTVEDQLRTPGATVEYPLAAEVGRQLGQAPAKAVADLESLASAMEAEEVWSKEDAERRLSQLQASRVEVEALPSRTWTRFVAGLGSSAIFSASALLAAEEARIWPELPSITDWQFYLPPGLLYLVGVTVLLVGLYYWSLDDRERRSRYELDFAPVPALPPGWWARRFRRVSRVFRRGRRE